MCSFETCSLPVRSNGLCSGHYQQLRKGKPLKPLRGIAVGRTCSFDRCGRDVKARNLCAAHYGQSVRGEELRDLRGRFGDNTCSFNGCIRPVRANDLCGSHNQQRRVRGFLSEILVPRDTTDRDESGNKLCPNCQRWLPESGFSKATGRPDGLDVKCRICNRARNQELRYNVEPGWYARQFEAQGGRCAICTDALDDGRNTHIDHDHRCCSTPGRSCGKCVRSLLCGPCNLGVGYFRDSPERLRRAADYVERG